MNLGEKYQRDLLALAIQLDNRLHPKDPEVPSFLKNFAEFLFTLAGILLGFFALRLPPARLANRISQAMTLYQCDQKPSPPDPSSLANLDKMKEGFDRFLKLTHKKPAIIFLTSHPETSGKGAQLLGEMAARAIQITELLSPGSKFRLVQAIDDYALDMLPLPIKGLYQGVMSQGHLTMHRMPGTKPKAIEALLSGSYYSRTIFAVLSALRRRDSVCAALSGGAPHNSRILYGIRESAQKLYGKIPLSRRKGKHRRDFELEIIRILSASDPCASISGVLSREERQELSARLESWGLSDSEIAPAIAGLEAELRLMAPYRTRFFQILFRRICGRGIPLYLIPIAHLKPDGTPGVWVGLGSFLSTFDRRSGEITVADLSSGIGPVRQDWLVFVRNFVETSFNPSPSGVF